MALKAGLNMSNVHRFTSESASSRERLQYAVNREKFPFLIHDRRVETNIYCL